MWFDYIIVSHAIKTLIKQYQLVLSGVLVSFEYIIVEACRQ